MGIENIVNKTKDLIKDNLNIKPVTINYSSLDEHLYETEKHAEDIFNNLDPKYHDDFRERLRRHLKDVREENKYLRITAGLADTIDRKLIPFDILADLAKPLFGFGYGLSAAKEVIEAPFKIVTSLYSAIKRKKILHPFKDAIYEGASFIVPGSLLDLTSRYTTREEKEDSYEAIRRAYEEFQYYQQHGKPPKFIDIGKEFAQEKSRRQSKFIDIAEQIDESNQLEKTG